MLLPKEYDSGSTTCHRRFQEWVILNVFHKLWIRLLKIYMTMSKISNGTDSHLTTAYLKGTFSGDMMGPNPTDRRGKLETKRHVITDKKGIPLSVIITAAANTHMI
jgi:hypothetical protein